MRSSNEIYLGKAGKIHGPYSEQDLQTMMAGGQLEAFVWIWKDEATGWRPIEPAPPSPLEKRGKGASGAHWEKLNAICYDRVSLIQGALSRVTETGCQLIGTPGDANELCAGVSASLNLLDPEKNACVSVPVHILAVEKAKAPDKGAFAYILRWEKLPDFATASLQKGG